MSVSSPSTKSSDVPVNPEALQALHAKVLGDCNAGIGSLLAFLGDKLGLFRLLAAAGPLTTTEVAEGAGLNERLVREWLSAVAAAGYVTYQPDGERFGVTPEQAIVFATEGHPAFLQGPIDLIYSLYHDEPKLSDAFRHGRGVPWGEHNACLFCATERFFGPLYRSSILGEWLPAIDGVIETLQGGADVADVGCGLGTSALIMAGAFPASRFAGFDSHTGSIHSARQAAAEAGLTDRVRFEPISAQEYAGKFDLICFFDALHDMGDPVGAAAHAKERLKPGGVVMLVEPYAEDRLEDNLSSERAPVSRFFYAASALACVPGAQAQAVGRALGAQAGPRRLTMVLQEAGFGRVRVAARTAMNLVLEARL
ncbi:MAG: methyltransferase domain-containing protein [Planctomycetes bacterium]|nr:methyltransferase domain-containing protein [Planctomycetota bacterium]